MRLLDLMPNLAPMSYSLLVCLLDTPFDRGPAGFAYLLTGLLLRGCWSASRHYSGKQCQNAENGAIGYGHALLPYSECLHSLTLNVCGPRPAGSPRPRLLWPPRAHGSPEPRRLAALRY